MRNFTKGALAILAVAALLVIVNPSSLWAIPQPVPEIDPSSGMAAITLIAGAVMLIRGLRKK